MVSPEAQAGPKDFDWWASIAHSQTFLAFFFEGYPKHFHGKAHQRALALNGYPITPYQTLTSWTQDHFVSIFSTFLRDKEPRKGYGEMFRFYMHQSPVFFCLTILMLFHSCWNPLPNRMNGNQKVSGPKVFAVASAVVTFAQACWVFWIWSSTLAINLKVARDMKGVEHYDLIPMSNPIIIGPHWFLFQICIEKDMSDMRITIFPNVSRQRCCLCIIKLPTL